MPEDSSVFGKWMAAYRETWEPLIVQFMEATDLTRTEVIGLFILFNVSPLSSGLRELRKTMERGGEKADAMLKILEDENRPPWDGEG